MNRERKRTKIHMHSIVYLLRSLILCMGFVIINPYDCMVVQAGHADKKNEEISLTEELKVTENTYTDSQGLIFTVKEDGSCTLSGYAGEAACKIVVPDDITVSGSTYKVKKVGSRALAECIGLNELVISNEITEIAPDAFSNDGNLEKIRIIPSKWRTKKREMTAGISIELNGLSTPEDVKPEVVITEEVLKKALNYKRTEEIRLTLKLNDSQSFPKITYGKKAAKSLGNTEKNLTLRLVDFQGGINLIKLKSADIKGADGNPTVLFNEITGEDNYGRADKDIKKVLKKNGINNIRVFKYLSETENKPPAELVLTAKQGGTFYAYRYIYKEGEFVSVSLNPPLTAPKGRLSFYVQKSGTYIITKKPLKSMVRALSNEYVWDAGRTYFADRNGKLLKGWQKKGENYYYFDRKNGEMIRSAKADGIKLRADGTAVATEYAKAKIDVMIKARKVVNEITDPDDTKEEKMEKCFLWVYKYPYRRFRTLESVSERKGWEITFANDIFDRKMGCCISESAALAFLFKECGCEEVYIGSDTSHGWVEYNGRVYDPLFAEAKGFSRYYNVSYESAKLWLMIKKQV